MQTKNPVTSFLKNSISLKLFVIFFLILILQIPLAFVRDLIFERQSLQYQAQESINASWGGPQTIAAPLIVMESQIKKSKKGVEGQFIYDEYILTNSILSESFQANIETTTEKRYLGIYEGVVYKSSIHLQGHVDLSVLEKDHLKQALHPLKLFIPIKELKGLKKIEKVSVNNTVRKISKQKALMNGLNGVYVELESVPVDQMTIDYDIEFEILGSQNLNVIPLAGDSQVQMKSNWSSPSFLGDFLPINRTINEEGFESQWQVNELNHNLGRVLPQDHAPTYPKMGVKFHIPANIYQVNQRTVKYSFLIIVLTFASFFLAELFFKLRLHPFQYLLVGVSLSVFYTLLLSLSEFLSFAASYALSTLSIVALIAGYCSVILGNRMRGILTGVLFFLLYGFIYILVNAEQLSLLMGSVGIWLFVAMVMYLTRKIDWYDLNKEQVDK